MSSDVAGNGNATRHEAQKGQEAQKGPDGGEPYIRTEFLERVSHELRGPSGVTLGAIDEMELLLGENVDKVKPLIGMARRGIRRVLRIAERLQRTAQLEGHHVEWIRTPMDVRTTLQQAVKDAELIEARKGVSVVLSVPSMPCVVPIDTPWMAIALAELVMNAIAHARKVVSVNAEVTDADVVISVNDDGAGFAEAPAERFNRPRDRRGIGLSLSLARDVVAAHGGQLLVETRHKDDPGDARGACVRVTLPRQETPAP
jgi:signal transduction histidine kinase